MSDGRSVGISGSECNSAAAGVEYHPPSKANPTPAVGAEVPVTERQDGPGASRAEASSDHPASEASAPIRILARRVDWLTTAFKVALGEDVLRHLQRRLHTAEVAERCAVQLAGASWELKAMRSGKRLLLRNADVAIVVDPEGPEGWTVQVEHPGATMMRTDLDDACKRSEDIAAALGEVKGARVRRLDLAADLAGWEIGTIDDAAWVKPGRAKLERARGVEVDKSDSPIQRRFRRGQRVTGYSICPGNPLMACIYDKREELTIRPDKRDAEEHRWREGGWDGAAPVARVEFRFRSEVLHELGARDGLAAFRSKLDALWQYASRWWVRLVDLASATRISRCAPSEAWRVVQSVRFRHEATPAVRQKMRKGASAAQVFGAALSSVAGASALMPALEVQENGRALEEQEIAQRMTVTQCEATLHGVVGGICAEASRLVVVDLLERLGPHRAVTWLLLRQEAARARFSECPPPAPQKARAAA